MALLESVEAMPILSVEGGFITYAASVIARYYAPSYGAILVVAVWSAGVGSRVMHLTPAEFSEWRRSFVKPEKES